MTRVVSNVFSLTVRDPSVMPAWYLNANGVGSEANLHQWVQIPGGGSDGTTRIDRATDWNNYTPAGGVTGQVGIMAYSGGAMRSTQSDMFIAGGGHADYAGNEIFRIRLSDDVPTWTRLIDPSMAYPEPRPVSGPSHYTDGTPAARHTYSTMQVIEARNLLMFFGAPAVYSGNANGFATVDAFDLATNEWMTAETFPSEAFVAVSPLCVKDSDENVWLHSWSSGLLKKWTQTTGEFSAGINRGPTAGDVIFAIDTSRNRIFRFAKGDYGSAVYDLNDGGSVSSVSVTGESIPTTSGGGMVYCPVADAYFLLRWGSTTLYRIDADTFAASVVTTSGSFTNPYINGNSEYFTRFNYAPELTGIVFVQNVDKPVLFLRTA
jgi:hypothetical protein